MIEWSRSTVHGPTKFLGAERYFRKGREIFKKFQDCDLTMYAYNLKKNKEKTVN